MNVHEFDREIPAGKSLLAECGDIAGERRVKVEVLATKTGWGKTEVRLQSRLAGWEPAGSMARWSNGGYAVQWENDGSTYGARYKTLEEAKAHFERIPTKSLY